MKSSINDFCKLYKEKLKLDKDIKETTPTFFDEDYRDRISFILTEYTTNPGSTWFPPGHYSGTHLFTLDSEDLEYLYNKYSKKLVKELEDNINEIKKEYNE